MSDNLQRFILLGSSGEERLAPVRGAMVRLERSWQSLLSRADYPPAVAQLLGEAAVAAALLASALKIEGKLTLQLSSEASQSPEARDQVQPLAVHLLVMQITSSLELRGLARWHGDQNSEAHGLHLVKHGRLVMTIETARGERYQGIVPLQGERLADALQGYFERSEQLPTRLWLQADAQHAAGLLLQRMPQSAGQQDDEDWRRAVMLAETLTREEQLQLEPETLLYRLFHEEDRRLYDAQPLRFRCSCSRERVGEMLCSLGADEIANILAEQEAIEVDCEFCNAKYRFDAVDAAALFTSLPLQQAKGIH